MRTIYVRVISEASPSYARVLATQIQRLQKSACPVQTGARHTSSMLPVLRLSRKIWRSSVRRVGARDLRREVRIGKLHAQFFDTAGVSVARMLRGHVGEQKLEERSSPAEGGKDRLEGLPLPTSTRGMSCRR
jgi:hypothetical protein